MHPHASARKRARIDYHDAAQPTSRDIPISHSAYNLAGHRDNIDAALTDSVIVSPTQTSSDTAEDTFSGAPVNTASRASSSAFRNVSACNRCRLRKNRCDQNLPSCSTCEKAGAKCVGFDPITKREIPRSYLHYLETRNTYLESLLNKHGIYYAGPNEFLRDSQAATAAESNTAENQSSHGTGEILDQKHHPEQAIAASKLEAEQQLDNLVSNISLVSVQGTSDPRYLGSTSGISFARVVFAAVKSTVSSRSRRASDSAGEHKAQRTAPATTIAVGCTTIRDSSFGLQIRPSVQEAPFPNKELAMKLVDLYFEHANPQMPILHRGDFMSQFNEIYTSGHQLTPRELYLFNIVFAIGAGVILTSTTARSRTRNPDDNPDLASDIRTADVQHQPEEYHASAIIHLENFLTSTRDGDKGFRSGLEELQAILLLASFALLRPVAPGLWYIVGVAVRLGIDLGLHYEDGIAVGVPENESAGDENITLMGEERRSFDDREIGRREWVRDLRRRLWWCCYSFDRLVSTCVGRPFGITDQIVTTQFPSSLDDKYISRNGFDTGGLNAPSYKFVSHHYFRLRLLQSEILQVLQFQQAQHSRKVSRTVTNPFMHTQLPSPFLVRHKSFKDWRSDIDRRLWEWKTAAPTRRDTGVAFQPAFLELNYWQAVIMLYRQSLTTPLALAAELAAVGGEVTSPATTQAEEEQDEEFVFLKIAEAGQKVLKIYRQMHRIHLVNYTFLATHHLFMAGISFLYAIWHSKAVRIHLTLDDVDFTILAAISVLEDLIDKCPPAEACRDAFSRMSKATIQMCVSTTGFGPTASKTGKSMNVVPSESVREASVPPGQERGSHERTSEKPQRPLPQFDMDMRGLFSNYDLSLLPEQTERSRASHVQAMRSFGDTRRRRFDIHPFNEKSQQVDNDLHQVVTEELDEGGAADSFLGGLAGGENDDFLEGLDMSGDFFHGANDTDTTNMLDLFGIGAMQGTHDFSDGSGVDLFEGFFFGNAPSGQPSNY